MSVYTWETVAGPRSRFVGNFSLPLRKDLICIPAFLVPVSNVKQYYMRTLRAVGQHAGGMRPLDPGCGIGSLFCQVHAPWRASFPGYPLERCKRGPVYLRQLGRYIRTGLIEELTEIHSTSWDVGSTTYVRRVLLGDI